MNLQPQPADVKQYTFTKEILNDPLTNTNSRHSQLCLYKIVDNKGNTAAQFHYYPKKQFIEIEGKEFAVSEIERFFKATKYLLIDAGKNQPVGEYKFNDSAIHFFWEDVPTEPNGTILLDDMVYYFRRIRSGVRSLRLRKETWGHFKFRLYAVKGDMYAEYTLKIDQPGWRQSMCVNLHSLNGTIETNTQNILVVVAAFYLMERVFETLDDADYTT